MYDILINNGFSDTEVAMINNYINQFGIDITIFKLGADDIQCVRKALGNCVYSTHKYISTENKITTMGSHWKLVYGPLPEVYVLKDSPKNCQKLGSETNCTVTHPHSYCGTSAVTAAVFTDGTGCSCNWGYDVDGNKCVQNGPAPPPPGPPSPTLPPSPPGPEPSPPTPSTAGTEYIKNTIGFTENMWHNIFPYTSVSSLWTNGTGKPYWNYNSFIEAIDYLNNHHTIKFRGFAHGTSGKVNQATLNKIELCAFLANMQQETGEPTKIVPSDFNLCDNSICSEDAWCTTATPASPCPIDCNQTCTMTEWRGKCVCKENYSWNDSAKKCTKGGEIPIDTTSCSPAGLCNGSAGGGIQLLEGAQISHIVQSKDGEFSFPASLHVTDCKLNAVKPDLSKANQPAFGLLGLVSGIPDRSIPDGIETLKNMGAISSDGTLYTGDIYDSFKKSKFWDESWNKRNNYNNDCPIGTNDMSKCSCLSGDIFCQYGGRGAIQLSYYYNYSQCSLELFGDFRLVVWPNLIIGTHNGKVAIPIPAYVVEDTPSPEVLGWLTGVWFWMTNRSGYSFSAHDAMQKEYGITCANYIVNNQSGCSSTGWAHEKNVYFKRICKAFDITDNDIAANMECPLNTACKKT